MDLKERKWLNCHYKLIVLWTTRPSCWCWLRYISSIYLVY